MTGQADRYESDRYGDPRTDPMVEALAWRAQHDGRLETAAEDDWQTPYGTPEELEADAAVDEAEVIVSSAFGDWQVPYGTPIPGLDGPAESEAAGPEAGQ